MKRRCRGCRAYLRTTNPDVFCDPCQHTHRTTIDTTGKPMTHQVLDALHTPATLNELEARTTLPRRKVERTVNHLIRRHQIVSDGRRGNQHTNGCTYRRADTD